MLIRHKLILYILIISIIPLSAIMAISIGFTSQQTEKLTLQAVKASVRASSESLSSYFAARVAEMQTYTQIPLVTSMQWHPMRSFLREEVIRHNGIYEKFILGVPSSHFRNTTVGNPALNDFASFNDKDPNAKLKSIKKRGYWQALVGTNTNGESRTHVSNPMISYTTGVKQVVVGSSILSDDGNLLGMLGGAIAWDEIEKRINILRDILIEEYGESVQLSLIDSDGLYIYHPLPEKVVHLVLDEQGKPLLNELNEKTVKLTNITEDVPELIEAGKDLLNRNEGYSIYTLEKNKQKMVAVYSPVNSSNYGLLVNIPKSVIFEPVNNLKSNFLLLLMITIILVILFAWLSSGKVVKRILSLNKISSDIADGLYDTKIIDSGKDEIAELSSSLSIMRNKLRDREEMLIQEKIFAEDANMAKSKFLANISHELRTPMHAISGFTNLAIKLASNEKAIKYLNNIAHSSKRLTGLLNNLLDLAKLESGKMESKISLQNLGVIVNKSIKELSSLIDEKKLSIDLVEKGNSDAEFDEELIHQVIINLLSNAIKYSPSGETISISIESKMGILNDKEQGILSFAIEDLGVGVPAEEFDSIFDSFTQSSNTDTNAGGTGLGLPICKEIIKIHHGAVWVESPIDHSNLIGSRFKFEIPTTYSH